VSATESDPKRAFLRHVLATLAYRGSKVLRGAPAGFGALRPGETSRTAREILKHVGDLFVWALFLVEGREGWTNIADGTWEQEVDRFFDGLKRLDDFLASDAVIAVPIEKVFQGPIADSLTHVGQIALLRRVAGAPVRGENYFVADIATGNVGLEQAPPRRELD
jgi:hypothetical protein